MAKFYCFYITIVKSKISLILAILHPLLGHSAVIQDKVLICGICKDIRPYIANTMKSAEHLGNQFLDYRIIIYENNSTGSTPAILKRWAKSNPKVICTCERFNKLQLIERSIAKTLSRCEQIAMARNKVLDIVTRPEYEDFKYVIWADLDFEDPWDISHIIETILHPEQPWDAVFANGAYDLMAFRDEEFPIGYELLGRSYFTDIEEIRSRFVLKQSDPWRRVYSAFGGLGIYKREAIKGCLYSGFVTQDLEKVVLQWLKRARLKTSFVPLLRQYEELLSSLPIIRLTDNFLANRSNYPPKIGLKLANSYGLDEVVWFSCEEKEPLPCVCEHIPFHASMALKGYDKLFINPRLIANHP